MPYGSFRLGPEAADVRLCQEMVAGAYGCLLDSEQPGDEPGSPGAFSDGSDSDAAVIVGGIHILFAVSASKIFIISDIIP